MSSGLARSFSLLSVASSSVSSASCNFTIRTIATACFAAPTLRPSLAPHHLPTSVGFTRVYSNYVSGTLSLCNLKPGQPTKTKRRVGRGSSSGRGGTSTRGHKGQKSRAGNGKPGFGFAGGQTPLTRLYPKRGFTNVNGQTYVPINLDKIQQWIDRGLLDPSKPITAKELYESRCSHSIKSGVKVLGDGASHLKTPINLIVSRASQRAMSAIEALGGSVECRYYTPLSLRALVKPEKFEGRLMPRPADPITKKELLWYSTPKNRGYLAKRNALKKAEDESS